MDEGGGEPRRHPMEERGEGETTCESGSCGSNHADQEEGQLMEQQGEAEKTCGCGSSCGCGSHHDDEDAQQPTTVRVELQTNGASGPPKIKRVLLIDIERDAPDGGWGQLDASWRSHPTGLLYLVSFVRERFPDMEFKVFHTSTVNNPRETVKAMIGEFAPDLIGLRSLSSARDAFIAMAQFVRAFAPGIPLIGGGPYPNASPQELVEPKILDLAVMGEGEETFLEIVQALRTTGRLPLDTIGTAVIKDGKFHVNSPRPLMKDLNVVPFPDYDLIDLNAYTNMANQAFQDLSKSAVICGSRGCPYSCFYCHQLFGKQIRRRTPENIVAELQYHVNRGIRNFMFVDDIFNVPKDKCKDILRLVIKEVPGIRLNFPQGLRADQMDEEVLDLFQQAGTVLMALAVESASPRLQKLMGKNLQIERARRSIEYASTRFVVTSFYIVGFPTETYEEAMSTIQFAKDLEYVSQPVLSVLRVYPGTFLYDLLKPTKEETERLLEQQAQPYTPTLFRETPFYGDVFQPEKVPLRGTDIRKIRWEWMMQIVRNPQRMAKSHAMLKQHFTYEEIIGFYRNFYDKRAFGHNDYMAIEKVQQEIENGAKGMNGGQIDPLFVEAGSTGARWTTTGWRVVR